MTSSHTALITGANRGIGRAMADRLATRGSVIGTHRGSAPAESDAITWETLDVTDPASHADLAARLGNDPIDLLVCNAGVYLDKGQQIDGGYDASLWAQTYAANVTGVFLTVQTLLPQLRAGTGTKVAVISSIMASSERAPGGGYIYRSSKAAVLNLGRNMAQDLRKDGIAVGIYHPGWVRTDMGGGSADISVDQSADGLIKRFDALSMETTGCFEAYDGATIPF